MQDFNCEQMCILLLMCLESAGNPPAIYSINTLHGGEKHRERQIGSRGGVY